MTFLPDWCVEGIEVMKKTIAILALAALGLTAAHAGLRFGINFGIPALPPIVIAPAPIVEQPPMPAPVVEVAPPCPVQGYVWVRGSWGWCDNHWVWTRGRWCPPAYWGRADFWHHGYRGGFHGERLEGFYGGHDRR